MNVLLVGNLPEDRQESMQRFTSALRDGLAARGHRVSVLTPTLRIARLLPRYRYNGLPKYLGYLDKFILFPRTLRRRIATDRPDVVHLTDHAGAVYRTSLRAVPFLATCHDLFEIRAACGESARKTVSRGGRLYQTWIRSALAAMPHLACVSQPTRTDALRLTRLPEAKVSLIPNALNHPYKPLSTVVARERLAHLTPTRSEVVPGKGGFLLQIGGEQWYKNRAGLLPLFAALRVRVSPAPHLIMVGPPLSPEHAALASELGITGQITSLTRVTCDQLEALYTLAEGLLFPSLAEGFGWPVAEAQACGCPVFASNRQPMLEVGGRHAVYFDPTAPVAGAQVIADAWSTKHTLRGPALAASVRWQPDLMIDAYEALYRRLSQ